LFLQLAFRSRIPFSNHDSRQGHLRRVQVGHSWRAVGPQGWGQACRFIALRYKKEHSEPERELYQLFDSPQYRYRVFVTDLQDAIDLLVWFYNARAGAENLIKGVLQKYTDKEVA